MTVLHQAQRPFAVGCASHGVSEGDRGFQGRPVPHSLDRNLRKDATTWASTSSTAATANCTGRTLRTSPTVFMLSLDAVGLGCQDQALMWPRRLRCWGWGT
jgi:hypothetical protein